MSNGSGAEFCVSLNLVCIPYVFFFPEINAPGTLVIYRRGHTRSHSEHGSQALLSRWYSERGRVGCRQRSGRVLMYIESEV
jgi:hypothetical protein